MPGLFKVSMKTETLQVNESKMIEWVCARSSDRGLVYSKTNTKPRSTLSRQPPVSRQTRTEVVPASLILLILDFIVISDARFDLSNLSYVSRHSLGR